MRHLSILKSLAATSLVAIAASGGAQVTITPVPTSPTTLGTFAAQSNDAFDVSQGTIITSNTPGPIFPAVNAIGGTTPNTGEPNNLIFSAGGLQGFSFRTAAPVTIGGFNLFLADDGDGVTASRGYSSVNVLGSLDGTIFTSLGSAIIPFTSYTAGYGSNAIQISSRFANATYQFFQFTGVATTTGRFAGGRVLELDAVGPSVAAAVPEPATWAMMIGGFAMVGGAMRRRHAHTLALA